MNGLKIIIALFIGLDVWIWLRIDRGLRGTRRPHAWRWILACSMGGPIGFMLITLLSFRHSAHWQEDLPPWVAAYIYIWHFLVLLPMVVGILIVSLLRDIVRFFPRSQMPAETLVPPETQSPPQSLWSRRSFLAATAFTLPPLATGAFTGMAFAQLGKFRIHQYSLALPGWPQGLDGFTIALVADIHVGVFSTPKMLRDIIESTNALRADLVLLGGDLINISQADLPSAIDIVHALDSRYGVYMIEGNHDVIEGADRFDAACRARGVPLLLDQVKTLSPRGIPFQLLGARWRPSGTEMVNSIDTLADARDPNLFPILLAHHPHTWDQAMLRGLPLTLSGHTHGGQIMLTKNIGAGPLRFKYWSGMYQNANSTLIVSNGVGNWFPLRINAPAEILHITLHSAPAI